MSEIGACCMNCEWYREKHCKRYPPIVFSETVYGCGTKNEREAYEAGMNVRKWTATREAWPRTGPTGHCGEHSYKDSTNELVKLGTFLGRDIYGFESFDEINNTG